MTFNSFFTERIYTITADENTQINILTEKYIDIFNSSKTIRYNILRYTPLMYFASKLEADDTLYLGKIKYESLQDGRKYNLDVYVSFEKRPGVEGSHSKDLKKAFIYYYTVGFNKGIILETITHEVMHAKQHYKEHTEKYKEFVKHPEIGKLKDYYFDPVEYPVQEATTINAIEQAYNEASTEQKEEILLFLKVFAQSGGSLPEEIKVPFYLENKVKFLDTLVQNKDNTKFKTFFKKLYWLYNKLK
jgi:hypothetical protein